MPKTSKISLSHSFNRIFPGQSITLSAILHTERSFLSVTKRDGLYLLSALKRCGIDPDSIAKDEDKHTSAKKIIHDDEENCIIGKIDEDLLLP